jgi:hypothetical protein
MDNITSECRRRGLRKQIVGDIFWSYASDKDENKFKGLIIDESESGLSILSLTPIKTGSTLKICCDGRPDMRLATVIWCKEIVPDIYQSGLLISAK